MEKITTNNETDKQTEQQVDDLYIYAVLKYLEEAEKPVRLYQLMETGTNPDYFIADNGDFISTFNGEPKVLKQEPNNNGYFRVKIRGKKYYTGKTVADYFIENENPTTKSIVHHKDSDKSRNDYSNLRHIDPFTHRLYHAMKRKYKDADVELQ